MNIEQELTQEIETAIQTILAASQKAAIAALNEAFSAAVRQTTSGMVKPIRGPKISKQGKKRSPEVLAQLEMGILEVVAANPGQTMTFIAGKLGQPVAELRTPASVLKRQDRVRTAGQRQFTRYYPVKQAGGDGS